jgi:hypothetical protein
VTAIAIIAFVFRTWVFPAHSPERLVQDVSQGDVRMAEVEMARRGFDPSIWRQCADCKATPIHQAVSFGNTSMVVALLKHGFDPNLWIPNAATPLTVAALKDDLAMIHVLLEHGADVNYAYWDPVAGRCSALVAAGIAGKVQAMKGLLAAGADPNQIIGSHTTPLTLMVQGKNVEVVRVLLEHGAEPTMFDFFGAQGNKDAPPEMLRLLRKYGSWENALAADFLRRAKK